MKTTVWSGIFSMGVPLLLCGCAASDKAAAPTPAPTAPTPSTVPTLKPTAQNVSAHPTVQNEFEAQHKFQIEYLNDCFPVIKRIGKKARVRVRLGSHLYLTQSPHLPPYVQDFAVGDSFNRPERDFDAYAHYVVKAINDQGLLIGYKVGRVPPNEVLLPWKPGNLHAGNRLWK